MGYMCESWQLMTLIFKRLMINDFSDTRFWGLKSNDKTMNSLYCFSKNFIIISITNRLNF